MKPLQQRSIVTLVVLVALAAAAWGQVKKNAADVEGQVRAAALQYYAGTVFGDADVTLKNARTPLLSVRDGAVTQRPESDLKSQLATQAERVKALSEEDRKRIAANMLPIFDEASTQFVGANTATVTFLVRPAKDPKEGDSLGTLVLFRKDGKWLVIGEITDSAPVPPSYLIEPGKDH